MMKLERGRSATVQLNEPCSSPVAAECNFGSDCSGSTTDSRGIYRIQFRHHNNIELFINIHSDIQDHSLEKVSAPRAKCERNRSKFVTFYIKLLLFCVVLIKKWKPVLFDK